MSAGILGPVYGALSQLVFVLLGIAGLPVFSGGNGGTGWILGPTGGFIIGYIFCALFAGLLIKRFGKSYKALFLAFYSGWAATYLCGILWFMYVTKSGLTASLTVCFLPFIPGDLLKTVISVFLIKRLDHIRHI